MRHAGNREPFTNHLGGVSYDDAGSVTGASGATYTYDGTGMMTRSITGTDDRQYVYTADDERIAVRQGVSWTWSVRDLGGKVLREFTSTEGASLTQTGRQWTKDYVWRDGLLLASTDATGTYHYHLDHLGTPRLILRRQPRPRRRARVLPVRLGNQHHSARIHRGADEVHRP